MAVPQNLIDKPPAPATQPISQECRNYDIVRATQFGVLERCMQLVESGQADVNQPDAENVTVLHWAAINNRIDIVR